MEIYNHQKENVSATPEEVFSFINDDANLKEVFGIIDKIEYITAEKRAEGAQFLTTLDVKGRTYRFRSEFTEYAVDRRIIVRSRFSRGDVMTQFTVVPNNGGVDVSIRSELRNAKTAAKVLATAMKPVIKVIMNRNMDKLVVELEK
ncbi:SRPBCC family protein [Lacicoccus alkaliphilus]|uniref:Carbon monoxide dehydrogenase subunit G n=1 Tax=Lacicoccus alkaliphilus DSM 16010 TaxID=1123231 RepID=A0A1M7J5C8_9BACL|nr:SRPBCC family protein [Salinicoccus alkaliphilus]SHM48073.1 Carbon monoxide dehydrogenase subunit G [Salinicoccus alkaliphilus DSM 16010]